MSGSSDDEYTIEQAHDEIGILRRVEDDTVTAIENAASEEVLKYLIETEALDFTHDGERGLGRVRRAILESPIASTQLKQLVSLRGDDTPTDVLVPENAYRNAKVASTKRSSVLK
jgi:5-methylcytosine-specific restriction protein B